MSDSDSQSQQRRRKRREPLAVDLTLVVRAGPEPEDRYVVMENRRIPMVGSVFRYRERIQRFMLTTMVRVATTSPSALREIAPGMVSLLNRVRKRTGGRRG